MQIRNLTLVASLILSTVFLLSSCVKDEGTIVRKSYTDEEYTVLSQTLDLPTGVEEYLNVSLPKHMESSGFSISGGEISNHGATLGRVLFYDKKLSKNNTVSCASCHEQTKGFADDRAFSLGFADDETKRNSLAIGNVRFYYHDRGFMWDERAESVEDQTKETVLDNIEMGMNHWSDAVDKIKDDAHYKILFRKAFGTEDITESKIQRGLSMFVRSIVSKGAKFDEAMIASNRTWLNGSQPLSGYTDSENAGLALYMNNCQSCHGNIIFLGRATANNGLDMNYEDKGIGAITNNPSRNGEFKVPFMRNIGLTAPYMHDGRFETLEEVIEHYSTGIKGHPNLAFDLPEGGFNFTESEKESLVAFLHTLTDNEMATEVRYSDPFK